MAAPVQTLLLEYHYPVERRIIHPGLGRRLGAGATQVRRRYQRPCYEFHIHNSYAVKGMAEFIFSFTQYHGPDISFWFSGNEWGSVNNPLLFAFGDGVRTQFFLNNRNITTGTLQTYRDEVLDGTPPAIDLPSGLLTYSSAPADGVELTAAYSCRYRCVFSHEAEVLMSEQLLYNQLYSYEGIVLREIVP